mgnify:CR=1 FL=1
MKIAIFYQKESKLLDDIRKRSERKRVSQITYMRFMNILR